MPGFSWRIKGTWRSSTQNKERCVIYYAYSCFIKSLCKKAKVSSYSVCKIPLSFSAAKSKFHNLLFHHKLVYVKLCLYHFMLLFCDNLIWIILELKLFNCDCVVGNIQLCLYHGFGYRCPTFLYDLNKCQPYPDNHNSANQLYDEP